MGRSVAAIAPSMQAVVAAGFDIAPVNAAFPVYTSFGDITEDIDVAVDFSHYSLQKDIVEFCVSQSLPLASATTGFEESQEQMVRDASEKIAVLRSANFSYGISAFKKILELAASLLNENFDIELIESHHNRKKDAPSGTAEKLAESVIKGAGKEYSLVYGRHGSEAKRQPGELGMHSIRGGAIVGKHSVLFAGEGETITLTHEALSRDVFATGAIKAAHFLAGRKPGYYSMDDIVKG